MSTSKERTDTQAGTEFESAIQSTTAPGDIPKTAGGDTSIAASSTERTRENVAGSSTSPEPTDTPVITQAWQLSYLGAPAPSSEKDTLPLLFCSHSTMVPSPSGSGSSFSGAETSGEASPSTVPTTSNGRSRSVASIDTTSTFTNTESPWLSPSWFSTPILTDRSSTVDNTLNTESSTISSGTSESTDTSLGLKTSHPKGFSTDSIICSVLSHTSSNASEARLGSRADSSSLPTTAAVSNISGSVPTTRESTVIPESPRTAEAVVLTMSRLESVSPAWPQASGVALVAEEMTLAVPRTERASLPPEAKVTETCPAFLLQSCPKSIEAEAKKIIPLSTPSPQVPASPGCAMGVPEKLVVPPGSASVEASPDDISPRTVPETSTANVTGTSPGSVLTHVPSAIKDSLDGQTGTATLLPLTVHNDVSGNVQMAASADDTEGIAKVLGEFSQSKITLPVNLRSSSTSEGSLDNPWFDMISPFEFINEIEEENSLSVPTSSMTVNNWISFVITRARIMEAASQIMALQEAISLEQTADSEEPGTSDLTTISCKWLSPSMAAITMLVDEDSTTCSDPDMEISPGTSASLDTSNIHMIHLPTVSRTQSSIYMTKAYTPVTTTGADLGAEKDSSPVPTTATASTTSSSMFTTGESTAIPGPSPTAGASALATSLTHTDLSFQRPLMAAAPVTSSGVIHEEEEANVAIPKTESVSLIPSTKVAGSHTCLMSLSHSKLSSTGSETSLAIPRTISLSDIPTSSVPWDSPTTVQAMWSTEQQGGMETRFDDFSELPEMPPITRLHSGSPVYQTTSWSERMASFNLPTIREEVNFSSSVSSSSKSSDSSMAIILTGEEMEEAACPSFGPPEIMSHEQTTSSRGSVATAMGRRWSSSSLPSTSALVPQGRSTSGVPTSETRKDFSSTSESIDSSLGLKSSRSTWFKPDSIVYTAQDHTPSSVLGAGLGAETESLLVPATAVSSIAKGSVPIPGESTATSRSSNATEVTTLTTSGTGSSFSLKRHLTSSASIAFLGDMLRTEEIASAPISSSLIPNAKAAVISPSSMSISHPNLRSVGAEAGTATLLTTSSSEVLASSDSEMEGQGPLATPADSALRETSDDISHTAPETHSAKVTETNPSTLAEAHAISFATTEKLDAQVRTEPILAALPLTFLRDASTVWAMPCTEPMSSSEMSSSFSGPSDVPHITSLHTSSKAHPATSWSERRVSFSLHTISEEMNRSIPMGTTTSTSVEVASLVTVVPLETAIPDQATNSGRSTMATTEAFTIGTTQSSSNLASSSIVETQESRVGHAPFLEVSTIFSGTSDTIDTSTDFKTSPARGAIPDSAVYKTLMRTMSRASLGAECKTLTRATSKASLGAECKTLTHTMSRASLGAKTYMSLEPTRVAADVSVASSTLPVTEESTVVSWPSRTVEVTVVPVTVTATSPTWSEPLTPSASSEVTPVAKEMNSDVLGSESSSLTPTSKMVDIVTPPPGPSPDPELPSAGAETSLVALPTVSSSEASTCSDTEDGGLNPLVIPLPSTPVGMLSYWRTHAGSQPNATKVPGRASASSLTLALLTTPERLDARIGREPSSETLPVSALSNLQRAGTSADPPGGSNTWSNSFFELTEIPHVIQKLYPSSEVHLATPCFERTSMTDIWHYSMSAPTSSTMVDARAVFEVQRKETLSPSTGSMETTASEQATSSAEILATTRGLTIVRTRWSCPNLTLMNTRVAEASTEGSTLDLRNSIGSPGTSTQSRTGFWISTPERQRKGSVSDINLTYTAAREASLAMRTHSSLALITALDASSISSSVANTGKSPVISRSPTSVLVTVTTSGTVCPVAQSLIPPTPSLSLGAPPRDGELGLPAPGMDSSCLRPGNQLKEFVLTAQDPDFPHAGVRGQTSMAHHLTTSLLEIQSSSDNVTPQPDSSATPFNSLAPGSPELSSALTASSALAMARGTSDDDIGESPTVAFSANPTPATTSGSSVNSFNLTSSVLSGDHPTGSDETSRGSSPPEQTLTASLTPGAASGSKADTSSAASPLTMPSGLTALAQEQVPKGSEKVSLETHKLVDALPMDKTRAVQTTASSSLEALATGNSVPEAGTDTTLPANPTIFINTIPSTNTPGHSGTVKPTSGPLEPVTTSNPPESEVEAVSGEIALDSATPQTTDIPVFTSTSSHGSGAPTGTTSPLIGLTTSAETSIQGNTRHEDLSHAPLKPTFTPGSSILLETSTLETVSSTLSAATPTAGMTTEEIPSMVPTLLPTPVDSLYTKVFGGEAGTSPKVTWIQPTSTLMKSMSPIPEKPKVQARTELGSSTLPPNALSNVPTAAEGDTGSVVQVTEQTNEDMTVMTPGIFSKPADASHTIQSPHTSSLDPPSVPWIESMTSLNVEKTSYSSAVRRPSSSSDTTSGAQTSKAAVPSTAPSEASDDQRASSPIFATGEKTQKNINVTSVLPLVAEADTAGSILLSETGLPLFPGTSDPREARTSPMTSSTRRPSSESSADARTDLPFGISGKTEERGYSIALHTSSMSVDTLTTVVSDGTQVKEAMSPTAAPTGTTTPEQATSFMEPVAATTGSLGSGAPTGTTSPLTGPTMSAETSIQGNTRHEDLSHAPLKPIFTPGSSIPLETSTLGTVSSTLPAATPTAGTTTEEIPSMVPTLLPTPVDSLYTKVFGGEAGTSPKVTWMQPTSTLMKSMSPVPERPKVQARTELGSSTLPPNTLSNVPTAAEGDTGSVVQITEQTNEDMTVMTPSTFSKSADTSHTIQSPHTSSLDPPSIPWTERMTSLSVENTSYSTAIHRPASSSDTTPGAQTSKAAAPSTAPTEALAEQEATSSNFATSEKILKSTSVSSIAPLVVKEGTASSETGSEATDSFYTKFFGVGESATPSSIWSSPSLTSISTSVVESHATLSAPDTDMGPFSSETSISVDTSSHVRINPSGESSTDSYRALTLTRVPTTAAAEASVTVESETVMVETSAPAASFFTPGMQDVWISSSLPFETTAKEGRIPRTETVTASSPTNPILLTSSNADVVPITNAPIHVTAGGPQAPSSIIGPVGGGPSTIVPSMGGNTEIRTEYTEHTDTVHITLGQHTNNKWTLETRWTDGMTSSDSPITRQERGSSTTLLVPSASLGTMTPVTMTGEQSTDAPSPPAATKGPLYPDDGAVPLASTEGFLPTVGITSRPDVTSTSMLMAEPTSSGVPQGSESGRDPEDSSYFGETTVGSITSAIERPSTDSLGGITLGHSSGVVTPSVGAEASSHLATMSTTEASPISVPVAGSDEAPTGPWLSTPTEAAMSVLSTGFSWLWTPTPATPEASSGSHPMVDDMSSAVPGTEGPNVTPSSKMTDSLPTSPPAAQHAESASSGGGASPVASMATTSLPLGSASSDTGTGAPVSPSTAVSSSWEGSRAHEVLSTGSETDSLLSLTTTPVEGSTRDVPASVTGGGTEGTLSQEPSTSVGETRASPKDTAPTGVSPISQRVSPATGTEASLGFRSVADTSSPPVTDLPTVTVSESPLAPGTVGEARSASPLFPVTWLSPSSISPMSTSENNGASSRSTTSVGPTEIMTDVSTSGAATSSGAGVSSFSGKSRVETVSSSAAAVGTRVPGFTGAATAEGAPGTPEKTSPRGAQLATTSGSGLTLSPPLTENWVSITTHAGSRTTPSTSASSQPMAPDTSLPGLLDTTSTAATSPVQDRHFSPCHGPILWVPAEISHHHWATEEYRRQNNRAIHTIFSGNGDPMDVCPFPLRDHPPSGYHFPIGHQREPRCRHPRRRRNLTRRYQNSNQ
ncbi:uncharacterized threonine-rich GPI-anchored glycoprotein PJ4664.02-like [Trichosurus vulpecula]|uniref:uncharacterized threonine-rich GPI-anchored glycoprotein PJ4664.02-like n=1 Tax=Trichosurus vulpecula TaxID=9337 RepID=UPI00186AEE23|nr:uncharacterized threonine-rich GPI-anchored glycoprotein PJ4664.02-like [Trichosurus vulpecula]